MKPGLQIQPLGFDQMNIEILYIFIYLRRKKRSRVSDTECEVGDKILGNAVCQVKIYFVKEKHCSCVMCTSSLLVYITYAHDGVCFFFFVAHRS